MLFNFVTIVALASSTYAIKAPRAGPKSALDSIWRRQEDPQKSLTLDPKVIARGFAQDGNPKEGQVPSLTSVNNFINFCLTQKDVLLTDGKQIEGGSCNQVPMGRIAANDKMPRSKFVFPLNLDDSLIENTKFTIKMKIVNIVTGNFVNAKTNYFAAPQFTDGNGIIIGHSHVTVQRLPTGFQHAEPLDPNDFAFFKGVNNPADGQGVVSVDVISAVPNKPDGLPAGQYRLCSINAAANHQPVLVARAQRGWNDDCVYFTVKPANGGNGGNNNNNNGNNNNNNNNNNNGSGNGGENLQKFGGNLGAPAPAVTKDGNKFKVNGQTFNDVEGAIQASCNSQRDQCADAANRTRGRNGVNIPACDDQRDKCMAGSAPQGLGQQNLNKFKGEAGNAKPVTIASVQNGRCFTDGATLPSLQDCVQRACNAQRNRCADNRNAQGGGINICDQQRDACLKQ